MTAIHRHETPIAAAEALADSVAALLRDRLGRRPSASLVVSGGTTPGPFFRSLRERDLPWERVVISLADERWVAPDHPDSNEGLVRRELLRARAGSASFVPLRDGDAPTPDDAAEAASARLAKHLPFDVAVLGMGLDGHTASLFPGARGLERALDGRARDACVVIDPAGGRLRLSLGASALLSSRHTFLHFTGPEKWEVFQQARRPGPVEELPVRLLLHRASNPVEVYWAP